MHAYEAEVAPVRLTRKKTLASEQCRRLAARRPEGPRPANRTGSGQESHGGPVRRCACLQPACRGALRGASALGARTPVPLHYAPRDRQRTTQARWIEGCRAAAKEPLARRHHPPRTVAAGIHAAPGRSGAAPAPAPDALSRGARAQCRAACGGCAGPGAPTKSTRQGARPLSGAHGLGAPAQARL